MAERTAGKAPAQDVFSRPEAEAASRPRRSARTFVRPLVLALLGLVAAALVVVAIRPSAPASVSGPPSGEAAIGGPFHLLDVNGAPADQRVLLGKWSAVFFGYTNCPDTCPATLQALNAAGQALGPKRRAFQVVFISVDPARDTPAQMKLYSSSQGYPPGGLVGLTGSPAQVKDVAGAYHVFYSKAGDGPDYAVQHSAAIYLMDPRGRFSRLLNETDPPATLAGQIKAAMAG
jgi:protein SCO1